MKNSLFLALCFLFMFSCKGKKNIENIAIPSLETIDPRLEKPIESLENTIDVNIIGDTIEEHRVFEVEKFIPQTEFEISIPKKIFPAGTYLKRNAEEIQIELHLQNELIPMENSNDYYLAKNYPDEYCNTIFRLFNGELFSYTHSYNLDKLNISDKQKFVLKTIDQFNKAFNQVAKSYKKDTEWLKFANELENKFEKDFYEWTNEVVYMDELLCYEMQINIYKDNITEEDFFEIIIYPRAQR